MYGRRQIERVLRTFLTAGESQHLIDQITSATAEQTVGKVENVRTIVNEVAVLGASSLTSRTNDAVLSGKVKASFVDAKDLQVNAFKVVTERGVVYLMGRVTEREATRASEIARGVSGVQKVVRVFEYLD